MHSAKAIVTGSDSGIGKATAVRLARDGFDVGVTWHTDRGGAAAYCAAKGGLGLVTKVMALELGEHGTRSTRSHRARSPRR